MAHPNLTGKLSNVANEVKMLIYGLFMYLSVNTEIMSVLASLMLIDTFFGMVKVFAIDPTKFRFKKLLIGFVSKMTLLLIPLVVALIGKGAGFDLKVFVDISARILIVSEGISILSNAIAIKTKKEVEDYDIITRFLKTVRIYLINIAEVIMKGKNKNEDNKQNQSHNNS